jgi:FRG domain
MARPEAAATGQMAKPSPSRVMSRQTGSVVTATAKSLSGYLAEVDTIVERFTPGGVDWYVSPWFRGHSNAAWSLEPGWYRQVPSGRKLGDAWYNEHNLLLEFKLHAPRYLNTLPSTDWEWLFVMQHYGLPTRLLDWTESALLGLYFAIRDNRGDTDAGVWALNPWWVNNRSLGRRVIPAAGEPVLRPWAPLDERGRLKGLLPVAIRPVYGSPRIAAQKGVFTVHGHRRVALDAMSRLRDDNGPGLCLIRIPAEAIADVRRQLAVAGVTETSAFQELDGLCREIKSGFFGL